MAGLFRNATILVVEDDSSLRTFYQSALAIAGYRVITAQDGIDALWRIDNELPDLVVLDLNLPRLGGRDVKAELKAHAETRHVPIMVVSGMERNDLASADVVCHLRKPVTAEQLIEAVETCLEGYGHSPPRDLSDAHRRDVRRIKPG
jgi:DNA-binding response OmpR family regulator